ncbi:tautomerase family protein [Acinetobacter seifertii]|uniref:Tautomerase family protein n=1 Tax=Acinetobacter seifertii TaxID=1530123 RepID=A0A5E9PKA5_9GAMM|nr:tautomerase family protein [Acinetobacter seifertii]TEU29688.1 tautomerase family protein [Acinetobacter seifertii]
MSQVKIYANEQTIMQYRELLSHAIHQALIEELKYPVEKRFQRFMSLKPENFIYPSDRSQHYIIIELSMFAGRSTETKKRLIQTLFRNIEQYCKITPQDIEITIFETSKENWGIRGQNADEMRLNYQVNV